MYIPSNPYVRVYFYCERSLVHQGWTSISSFSTAMAEKCGRPASKLGKFFGLETICVLAIQGLTSERLTFGLR